VFLLTGFVGITMDKNFSHTSRCLL